MKRLMAGFVAIVSLFCLLAPVPVSAQVIDDVCEQKPDAKVCSDQNDQQILGADGVVVKVARMIGVVTAVASVIAVMIGGFKYIMSTGDSAAINSAKNTILYALIGLVISVSAPFIIGYAISFLR